MLIRGSSEKQGREQHVQTSDSRMMRSNFDRRRPETSVSRAVLISHPMPAMRRRLRWPQLNEAQKNVDYQVRREQYAAPALLSGDVSGFGWKYLR